MFLKYCFSMTSEKNGKSASKRRVRYKNEPFLKALGSHCRHLRNQKNYSIDRLSKESDQLSPASIDRLERGLADSQILILVRYAETLGVALTDLFAFLKDNPDLSKDSRIIPYDEGIKPPKNYVPVYPIKVAAGKFTNSEELGEIFPLGWVEANIKAPSADYFASFIRGESMSPKIADGSLCLFRRYTGGSRQNRIFLIQARGLTNSETGEAFVIKKYVRQTPPRQSLNEEIAPVIHLVSENSRFPPIVLVGLKDEDIQTIAEFIKVL